MPLLMKILGCEANPSVLIGPNTYLQSADFDTIGGDLIFTSNRANAMRFAGLAEGLTFWKTTSRGLPFRPDGQPNRPLTAFSVTFEQVPE